MHGERCAALGLQLGGQRFGVQRDVHGIARLRMGQAKTQQLGRGQGCARTPQGQARLGVGAEVVPGVGRDAVWRWFVCHARSFHCRICASAGC